MTTTVEMATNADIAGYMGGTVESLLSNYLVEQNEEFLKLATSLASTAWKFAVMAHIDEVEADLASRSHAERERVLAAAYGDNIADGLTRCAPGMPEQFPYDVFEPLVRWGMLAWRHAQYVELEEANDAYYDAIEREVLLGVYR